MTAPAVTIYTTPTCAPCGAAKRRLTLVGIPYTVVDLTESEADLAALKERLGTTTIQTPLFAFEDEILTIADLPRIIAVQKERNQS